MTTHAPQSHAGTPPPRDSVLISLAAGAGAAVATVLLLLGLVALPGNRTSAEAVGELACMLAVPVAVATALGTYWWRTGKRGLGLFFFAGAFAPIGFVTLIAASRFVGPPPAPPLDARARGPLLIETRGDLQIARHAGLDFTFSLPDGFEDAPERTLALRETTAQAMGADLVQPYILIHPDGATIVVTVSTPIAASGFDDFARAALEQLVTPRLLHQEMRGEGARQEMRASAEMRGAQVDLRVVLIPGPRGYFYPLGVVVIGLPTEESSAILESIRFP